MQEVVEAFFTKFPKEYFDIKAHRYVYVYGGTLLYAVSGDLDSTVESFINSLTSITGYNWDYISIVLRA